MAVMGWKKNKVIIVAAFLTFLFCSVISFDLFPFLRGPAPYPPDWQWEYLFVNTFYRCWMPILFMGLTLGFTYFLEQKAETYIVKHEKKILCCLLVLFLCLQISISYYSRAGVGVLVSRIINPDMNGYFTAANSITNIPLFLKNFEQTVLALPMHAQGHPPGAILFFWIIEKSMQPFSFLFYFVENITISHSDVAIIWNGLNVSQKVSALFSAFFIPFLSTLSCIFVYYIGKYLYSVRVGSRAAIMLLATPSLLLFIPINDVFLPLFPLCSFLSFSAGIKRNNKLLLFISGIIFSLGIFFSLSLVPLLFIFLVFLLWPKNVKDILQKGVLFSCGILSLPIVLFLLYGYNTITVSQTLLSGLPEGREYFLWILFDLVDFFVFLGIPFFIYLCWQIRQVTKNILSKKFATLDPLTIGFIGMLFLLNISGSVRGEVARIWIPFYPFLIIMLGVFITKSVKIPKIVFVILLGLQFLQILFMQEFWVMLW